MCKNLKCKRDLNPRGRERPADAHGPSTRERAQDEACARSVQAASHSARTKNFGQFYFQINKNLKCERDLNPRGRVDQRTLTVRARGSGRRTKPVRAACRRQVPPRAPKILNNIIYAEMRDEHERGEGDDWSCYYDRKSVPFSF
jgi:hypothetical protein